MAAEPNIAPYLCRSIVEHYARRDIQACASAVADLWRIVNIVTRWAPANARWLKMAMRVLELPGGTGVLRPPYLLPEEVELQDMKRLFDQFGISRVEDAAREKAAEKRPDPLLRETAAILADAATLLQRDLNLVAIVDGAGGFVINGQCAGEQSGWTGAGAPA